MLEAEDYGKDLATVQNLVQKHKLLEADVSTHDDRVSDLNDRADAFIDSDMWDTENIKEKKQSINERYERYVLESKSNLSFFKLLTHVSYFNIALLIFYATNSLFLFVFTMLLTIEKSSYLSVPYTLL